MYLIVGSNGQLGRELSSRLQDAILTDVTELDITDARAVRSFVKKKRGIDAIINCAAYTAVDRAEDDVKMATKINVNGPANLAKTGINLVHISTDYVFDGTKHRPYQPEDKTNPLSVYGKTKLAGEKAVLKFSDCGVIIRTAWLYSPYGNNFVKTMQRLGAERKNINVVTDQIGTPTYAGDLADAIVKILPNMKKSGVYHFTNAGVCSWYDFARKVMELSGLQCEVNPILSSEYPTRAKRPFYSVLDKTRIAKEFDVRIRHWEDALRECIGKMKAMSK